MIDSAGTIAAIATPPGRGAIGIVRVSGSDAAVVLSRVFYPNKAAGDWVSRRMEYGTIRCGGMLIDEVMAVVMRSPRSYTKEDTAEIYTHGGMESLRGVLNAVLQNGARPANPGEFTQRAFLNGRINLTQAEAVMDVINAKTSAANQAALRLLGGGLSDRIDGLRNMILRWLANIELSIDYPEHESEAMNRNLILNESAALLGEIEKLLSTAKMGRILSDGVRTAIIGRPNVGKSSLLNAILREDRAIVTEIPGTTRDILSETVRIHGIPLILSDTAGIRETDDLIEKQGVDKAAANAEAAALVLFVADASQPPEEADFEIFERIKHKQVIAVLNKSDMPRAEEWGSLVTGERSAGKEFNTFINGNCVAVSAREHTGLNGLYEVIRDKCMAGLDNSASEADIITHERHAWLLEQAAKSVSLAVDALKNGVPEDLVSVDLREAYRALGEIIGEEIGDDIVERIFSEFCVGK